MAFIVQISLSVVHLKKQDEEQAKEQEQDEEQAKEQEQDEEQEQDREQPAAGEDANGNVEKEQNNHGENSEDVFKNV